MLQSSRLHGGKDLTGSDGRRWLGVVAFALMTTGCFYPMEVTFSVHSQGASRSGALGVLPASGSAQVMAVCGETVVACGVGVGKSTQGSAKASEDGDASINLRINAAT